MPDCSINGDCNAPSDPDCLMNGCVGADGLAGTMDDSIDVTTACRHEVDQGAICYATAEPMDVITAPRCTTGGASVDVYTRYPSTEQPAPQQPGSSSTRHGRYPRPTWAQRATASA